MIECGFFVCGFDVCVYCFGFVVVVLVVEDYWEFVGGEFFGDCCVDVMVCVGDESPYVLHERV